MKVFRRVSAPALLLALGILAGCNDVPLAPGAERVVITRNPSDVASCTPVGNIDARIQTRLDQFDPTESTKKEVQNQAVGLGGDVVLDTTATFGPTMGVIYRCHSGSTDKK